MRRQHVDDQLEMGKAVAHLAGAAPRPPTSGRRSALRRWSRACPATACRAVRSCRRADLWWAGYAAAPSGGRRSARNARRSAPAAPSSAPCAAVRPGCPGAARRTTRSTGRRHIPARPACKPPPPGRTAPARSRSAGRGRRDRRRVARPPRESPVWRPAWVARWRKAGRRPVPRCRPPARPGCRTRSRRPPPRCRRRFPAEPATRQIGRKAAGRGHHLGTGVQVASPRVVAKPRPRRQHVVQRCGRQRLNRREAAYEPLIVRYDCGDGRLL